MGIVESAPLAWITSAQLSARTGLTYRQIDYMCRTGQLDGYGGDTAGGSGTRRRFDPRVVPGMALSERLREAFGMTAGVATSLTRAIIDATLKGEEYVEFDKFVLSWDEVELDRMTQPQHPKENR